MISLAIIPWAATALVLFILSLSLISADDTRTVGYAMLLLASAAAFGMVEAAVDVFGGAGPAQKIIRRARRR